jgi:hypothetical protein
MFWIYRDDFAAADEIDYGFVHENQTVSAERGGRARIAFPDPAGGAGQNWRADRSSTTRSISAADRRITAHRDPIARTTKVNPLGIYSGSKAAGGRPVCEAVATHMILRTAWIYGAHGQNLVKAILRLAGERPRLRVVADQLADGNALGAHFIFSGGGAITWHGFAEVCSRIAESYGITPLPWRETLCGGHCRA